MVLKVIHSIIHRRNKHHSEGSCSFPSFYPLFCSLAIAVRIAGVLRMIRGGLVSDCLALHCRRLVPGSTPGGAGGTCPRRGGVMAWTSLLRTRNKTWAGLDRLVVVVVASRNVGMFEMW